MLYHHFYKDILKKKSEKGTFHIMITTTETKLLPEILAYLVNRPMVYTKPNVVNIDL